MQMYRLVTGTAQKIADFEKSISMLLEDGYALEGPLVTSHDTNGTHLFQAMIVEDYFLEEDEEDEEAQHEDE